MSVIDELEDLKKRQEESHRSVIHLMQRIAELEKLIGVNSQSTPPAAADDDLGSVERPMMVEDSDEEKYIIVCRYNGPKGPPIFMTRCTPAGRRFVGSWSRFRKDARIYNDEGIAVGISGKLTSPRHLEGSRSPTKRCETKEKEVNNG